MMTKKELQKRKARARKVGKSFIVKQVSAKSGISLSGKSIQDVGRWAKYHPEILPSEIRSALVVMSGRRLCEHLGHHLRRESIPERAIAQKKKTASDFYRSWKWKKLRFHALKRYGPKCMLCGSEERIVVDHIKPRSKFPELELDPENLQVLCNDCNMGKSNDDYTDFRPGSEELTREEYAELDIVSKAREVLH